MPYYLRDPKREPNFDNPPHIGVTGLGYRVSDLRSVIRVRYDGLGFRL